MTFQEAYFYVHEVITWGLNQADCIDEYGQFMSCICGVPGCAAYSIVLTTYAMKEIPGTFYFVTKIREQSKKTNAWRQLVEK